eukprot:GFYU01039351.1.p1 GENE.GFYU01039351.1~~GFYU01039351.1.p1  ORF type:complete len:247 (+),score=29.24 GFYU01039351.1:18-758(+)
MIQQEHQRTCTGKGPEVTCHFVENSTQGCGKCGRCNGVGHMTSLLTGRCKRVGTIRPADGWTATQENLGVDPQRLFNTLCQTYYERTGDEVDFCGTGGGNRPLEESLVFDHVIPLLHGLTQDRISSKVTFKELSGIIKERKRGCNLQIMVWFQNSMKGTTLQVYCGHKAYTIRGEDSLAATWRAVCIESVEDNGTDESEQAQVSIRLAAVPSIGLATETQEFVATRDRLLDMPRRRDSGLQESESE